MVVGCFCVFDRLTSAAFPYPTFPPFCSFSSSAPSSQPGRTTDRGNVRRKHFPLTWHHFRARFVPFFPGSLKFASHTTLYPTFIFMNPEITSFRTGKNLVIDDETRKRRGSTAAVQRNLGDGKCHRVPGSVFGNFSVVGASLHGAGGPWSWPVRTGRSGFGPHSGFSVVPRFTQMSYGSAGRTRLLLNRTAKGAKQLGKPPPYKVVCCRYESLPFTFVI